MSYVDVSAVFCAEKWSAIVLLAIVAPGQQEEDINGCHPSKTWLKQMDVMALPDSTWMDGAVSPRR